MWYYIGMKFNYTTVEIDGIKFGMVNAVLRNDDQADVGGLVIIDPNMVGMASLGDLVGLGELLMEMKLAMSGDVIDFKESGVNWMIP